MIKLFTQGFLLQASLILVLGAQNLFIMDMGLKRNNHLLVATICSICDVFLIMAGVLGASALIVQSPIFKIVLGIIGALFLLYYAFLKIKDAYRGQSLINESGENLMSRKLVVLATLGFTLLNPHVYIDTFFLIGGYSTRFNELSDKLIFGVGAGVFSVIWFYFLAGFSSKFSTFLNKEKNMRIVNLVTGLFLSYLAINLGFETII